MTMINIYFLQASCLNWFLFSQALSPPTPLLCVCVCTCRRRSRCRSKSKGFVGFAYTRSQPTHTHAHMRKSRKQLSIVSLGAAMQYKSSNMFLVLLSICCFDFDCLLFTHSLNMNFDGWMDAKIAQTSFEKSVCEQQLAQFFPL